MSRLKIIISVVAIVGGAAWLLFPPLAHYMAQELVFDAQKRGLKFRVDGLEGRRFGIAAEGAEGWFSVSLPDGTDRPARRKLPISISAENLQLSARIPLLRPWGVGARFSATAYGGSIEGIVDDVPSSPVLSGTVRGVDLSQHPQLRALGVASGGVNIDVEQLPVGSTIPKDARYLVEVAGLRVELPPMVAVLAKLESVSDIRVKIQGALKTTGRFNISEGAVVGSFGRASVTAQGRLQELELRELAGSVDIELSGQDGEALRPWASLLSNASGSDAGVVHCAFKSGSCTATAPFLFNLGSLCVLASCS